MNFRYEYSRTTTAECPMFYGQMALKIIETNEEDAKSFTDVINDLLNYENKAIKEIGEFEKNVLGMRYILLVKTISKEISMEDIDDIAYGMRKLDSKSGEYRHENAPNDLERFKEDRRRIHAALCAEGNAALGKLLDQFDTVNFYLANEAEEEIEKNVVNLMEVAQRINPTTFVVNTTLANKLSTGSSSTTKILEGKVRTLKNVFAPLEDSFGKLENPFVRAL